jgi:large subunit ribosomal protein L18
MNTTARISRHKKVRKTVFGLEGKPRLAVFRSGKHIYAQVIDDISGKTVVAYSDLKIDKKAKIDKAFEVGKKIAEAALKRKVKKVVFDRGGFLYHGRIAKLAEGAREGGLEF